MRSVFRMLTIATLSLGAIVGGPANAYETIGGDPVSPGSNSSFGTLKAIQLTGLSGGFELTNCAIDNVATTAVCDESNLKLWSRSSEGNVCAARDVYDNGSTQTTIVTSCAMADQYGGRGLGTANVTKPNGCGSGSAGWHIAVKASSIYYTDSQNVRYRLYGELTGTQYTHPPLSDDKWNLTYAGQGFAYNADGTTRYRLDFNWSGLGHASTNCGGGSLVRSFVIDSLAGDAYACTTPTTPCSPTP